MQKHSGRACQEQIDESCKNVSAPTTQLDALYTLCIPKIWKAADSGQNLSSQGPQPASCPNPRAIRVVSRRKGLTDRAATLGTPSARPSLRLHCSDQPQRVSMRRTHILGSLPIGVGPAKASPGSSWVTTELSSCPDLIRHEETAIAHGSCCKLKNSHKQAAVA